MRTARARAALATPVEGAANTTRGVSDRLLPPVLLNEYPQGVAGFHGHFRGRGGSSCITAHGSASAQPKTCEKSVFFFFRRLLCRCLWRSLSFASSAAARSLLAQPLSGRTETVSPPPARDRRRAWDHPEHLHRRMLVRAFVDLAILPPRSDSPRRARAFTRDCRVPPTYCNTSDLRARPAKGVRPFEAAWASHSARAQRPACAGDRTPNCNASSEPVALPAERVDSRGAARRR